MKRALLLLLVSGCAGVAPATWAFDPDAEEGVHAKVEIEWWYHWGFLSDEAGREWTLFTTFFRILKPGFPPSRYFLYDLTDLATGERSYRSAAGEEVLKVAQKTGLREFPRPHQVIPGTVQEKA